MNDDEAKEVLYRVDERTRNMEKHLQQLSKNTTTNRKEIAKLREATNTNSQDINTAKAFLGLLSAAISGVMLKVFEVISI